jgi:teichuronic acid biosynthesis glycosyltransferase TuaH
VVAKPQWIADTSRTPFLPRPTESSVRSDRPRILYLSHIDWRWIKQRPQFIAEQLAESFDVLVADRRLWRRDQLVREPSPLIPHPIWRLPFRRFAMSAAISRKFEQRRIEHFVERFRPDLVWLCYPSFHDSLPSGLRRTAKLVYDCMDEPTAFAFPHEQQRVVECESRLLEEADLVLCSSSALADDLRARGARQTRLRVVRNAFAGEILPTVRSRAGGDRLRAGYAGTVAEWLDFPALLAALEALPRLEVHLLGPIEANVVLPRHARLIHHPPVPHAEVARRAQAWDLLVLPFVRSPLIDRVDPVKLYEYLNIDLPIVAVAYPEIDRFEPFVDFYTGATELIDRLRARMDGAPPKYTPEQRVAFLTQNTWARRGDEIADALALLL